MFAWVIAGIAVSFCLYLFWSRHRIRNGLLRLAHDLETDRDPTDRIDELHGIDPKLGNLASMTSHQKAENVILEGEARAADELFRSVVEELPDGLLLVDNHLEVCFFNQRASDLFPQHSIKIGKPLIEACGNHRLVESVEKGIVSGTPVRDQIKVNGGTFRDKEILERHYSIESSLLNIKGGSNAHAWVLIRDITEQLHTEQIRTDFVANASHELRTPLTLINGYIENLSDSLAENPVALKRALKVMQKHGERLSNLTEDMLILSKLEGGPEIRSEEFDFGLCAADVLDHLANPLDAIGGKILESPKVDTCPMTGDRPLWDQILVNLVGNAIKQNPQGAGIGITWESLADEWVVRVWDTGVGIPSADLPFIFKRFYRVEKHHSQKDIKGTGLGLSIVNRAVTAHGGTIRVDSTPGKRTEFTIRVPKNF